MNKSISLIGKTNSVSGAAVIGGIFLIILSSTLMLAGGEVGSIGEKIFSFGKQLAILGLIGAIVITGIIQYNKNHRAVI